MNLNESQKKTRQPKKSLAEVLEKELLAPNKPFAKTHRDNFLIIGEESTIKTGSTLQYLCDNLKKDEKIIIIDIDRRARKNIQDFHEDRYNDNEILYFNPFTTKIKNGNKVIDYYSSCDNVQNITDAIDSIINNQDFVIKGVIVDGMSPLLTWTEYKMREERGLDIDEGTSTNVWKLRQKFFSEIYTMFLELAVPVYLIAHDDFLADKDGYLSGAKDEIRKSVDYVIVFSKTKKPTSTIFEAKILKDADNIVNINDTVVFATVDNESKKYKFNPEKIFELVDSSKNKLRKE